MTACRVVIVCSVLEEERRRAAGDAEFDGKICVAGFVHTWCRYCSRADTGSAMPSDLKHQSTLWGQIPSTAWLGRLIPREQAAGQARLGRYSG